MIESPPLLDFKIIDETDDYAVVDKPPFLLIHPTKPDGTRTLWQELRRLFAFEIAAGGQVSIVNRLDRETSGLVLVAKKADVARRFGVLMQRRQLKKEYLAIVYGWPQWESTLVDAALDRQGKYRDSAIWLKQMIHPSGAPAQTEFKVERRFVRWPAYGATTACSQWRGRAIRERAQRRQIQLDSRDSAHRTHAPNSSASLLDWSSHCGR